MIPSDHGLTQKLTIIRPDDFHLHLRDGAMMAAVLPESARHFGRAIIMPNLVPPVVTAADASAYRERIFAHLPQDTRFEPLMTLYLTEATNPDDVALAFGEGIAKAVKLYPAGATTNSQSGVRDIERVYPVLERMAEIGMPLCVHGEVADPPIDIFDRESVFLDTVLHPLRLRYPQLRIILEHVTTEQAVNYVHAADRNLAATVTVHHLIINRNALFAGGIRPHYYCLPVAKRERHRQALLRAATSGDSRFFLGTDSAPHAVSAKESDCGCAGIFTASNALACLAHIFETRDKLDGLEDFTSTFGARYYGLAPNRERINLIKRDQPAFYRATIPTEAGPVVVFDPMFPLYWDVEEV